MEKYVTTSLDQFLGESKAFTLKRKYADRPAVVVGTKAPLRTQVLSYVAENAKVTLPDLKKFIMGLNEGKARPAAASMWIKRNAQFFVMENAKGVTYFKLSNLGKKLVSTGVVPATTSTATAPTMGELTNEGCGCKKRRPPFKRDKINEDSESEDHYPEDEEDDFGLGDHKFGVDRPRMINDEEDIDEIEEFDEDEPLTDDEIVDAEDEEFDAEDELGDEDLEDEDEDEDEDNDLQTQIDDLQTQVEDLKAIIDELMGEDDDIDDEEIEDEEIEDEEIEDDEEFEGEEDIDDDNVEAMDFEEDPEIDESSIDINDLPDEEDDENYASTEPMKRRRPVEPNERKYDFKDHGRPGLHDMDESIETPEERVKRVIESIKAKRAAALLEAEEKDKAQDVGSTPPAEDKKDDLTDADVEDGGASPDVDKPEGEEGGEQTEPQEEKVEITEFVITVDNLEEAMKELEELGIHPERVPKEAETTEPMPQQTETPEPAADAAPATEAPAEGGDDLDLDLDSAPAQPVKEAEGDDLDLDLDGGDGQAAAPAQQTEAPAEGSDDLDLDLDGGEAPAEGGETLPATTEFEENKLKIPAENWDALKGWLEQKGVDVAEMFGGEIEVEEEPGTMNNVSDDEINFDDLEIEDDTKVDTGNEEGGDEGENKNEPKEDEQVPEV